MITGVIESCLTTRSLHMKKFVALAALAAVLSLGLFAFTGTEASAAGNPTEGACILTSRQDQDGNGIGDAGVQVICAYTSIYAEDGNGDWYWDLGDGRIYGTVGSIDELDPETVVACYYQVNTRGDFGNDPYMDSGVIMNEIHCSDGTAYTYFIVSQDNPLYTGNPDWAIWGTWEYHVLVESGSGNLVAVLAHSPQP